MNRHEQKGQGASGRKQKFLRGANRLLSCSKPLQPVNYTPPIKTWIFTFSALAIRANESKETFTLPRSTSPTYL